MHGMIGDLLFERGDIREIERRRARQGVLHEAGPDRKRSASAGLLLAERVLLVVKADPNARGELWREADKPSVR